MKNCVLKSYSNDAVEKIKKIADNISPNKRNESVVGKIIKNNISKEI